MSDLGPFIGDSVLATLIPVNALTPEHRRELVQDAKRVELCAGETLAGREKHPRRTLYLLEGTLELLAGNRVVDTVAGGSDTARYALSQLRSSELSARARTAVTLLEIDAALLSSLLVWTQSAGTEEKPANAGPYRDVPKKAWMPRLLRSDLFSRIPPANVQRVLRLLEPVPVEAGETVVRQGDPGDYYFVIREGRCKVTRAQKSGSPPTVLSELFPGDRFGEEALVSGASRNASVTMLTDGVLLRLTKDDFVDLIKEPLVRSVTLTETQRLRDEGAVLLDVRLPDEYENDGLAGSTNIPLPEIRGSAGRLERSKTYIVYSNNMGRASAAAFLLKERGLNASVLKGGLTEIGDVRRSGRDLGPTRVTATAKGQGDSAVEAESPSPGRLKLKAAAELKEFLTRANAELETALRNKAEATMARRLTEQEAAALSAEAAGTSDDAKNNRLNELRTQLKVLQLRSNTAGRALNQAQRKKLEVELAIRSAEAETERERAIAEATCHRLRERTRQRLRSEEEKLQTEYQRATSELEKLRKSRAAAEAGYQEERKRLEADYAATRRRLEQDARRVQDEVKALEVEGKARTEKIRGEQALEEEQVRSRMKTRLRAKRERLEAEFAQSVATLEKAQTELRKAEENKRAAHEEAKRLITELKMSREHQRAVADARLEEETKRLERESSRAAKELARAEQLKQEAEAARSARERRGRKTDAPAANATSDIRPSGEPVLEERLEGIEARIAVAQAQLNAAARAKTDAERASRAAEERIAQQRIAEDEVRLQVSERFESLLREERERSEMELTGARKAVEEMGRARTAQDGQASEAAEAAMMAEISAQLRGGSGEFERAVGARAYAEEMAALTRSAHEAALEERRKAKQALQRARKHVAKANSKDPDPAR